MIYCKLFLAFLNFIVSIHYSTCQRRIVDGNDVTSDKRYMVYLIQSPESKYQYTGWLCGGAIVHPWYILTAAACLYNMQNVYVIAGINYYVKAEELSQDFCASNTKRRIMRYCSPDKYNFENFDTNGEWYSLDISLGKVDKPYCTGNDEFKYYACTYIPDKIGVNYNTEFVKQFGDVMALGWGSLSEYGMTDNDTNSPFLQYKVGYLMERSECKRRILKYFKPQTAICFNERGSVDDQGKLLDLIEDCGDLHNGCADFRRNDKDSNVTYGYKLQHIRSLTPENYRRFGGLCQNDHGGPLVGWVGGKEIVMGVASFFMVAKNMSCLGPSVFTSTACVNKFLYCKLKWDGARRSAWCNKHKNFTEETDMLWT